MNKDWHAKNKMLKRATMAQRIHWHEEHTRACAAAVLYQRRCCPTIGKKPAQS